MGSSIAVDTADNANPAVGDSAAAALASAAGDGGGAFAFSSV
jgi:hypothetical protein